MDNEFISSDIMTQWQDMNPLSTLHDVLTVMKPELSTSYYETDTISVAIGDDNIISVVVKDGSIGTVHLSSKAVTTEKIADGAVSTTQLSDDAVTNEKIADNAIDTA